MEKPSFGKPLEEHLVISGREIAFPVEACVTMLLECGMQEEVGLERPPARPGPSALRLRLQGLLSCYRPHPGPHSSKRGEMGYSPPPAEHSLVLLSPVTLHITGTHTAGHEEHAATLQPFLPRV